MLLTSNDAREMYIHDKIVAFNASSVIKIDTYHMPHPKFKFNDLCVKRYTKVYTRVIATVMPISFGDQPCYLVYRGEEDLSKVSDSAGLDLFSQKDFEKLFKHSYAFLNNL